MQDSTAEKIQPTGAPDEGFKSLCVGVCRLDDRQICIGCGRHIVEIAAAGVAAERKRTEKL
jgi:predicted Fe-S protein YdhL (DUF1289 family)